MIPKEDMKPGEEAKPLTMVTLQMPQAAWDILSKALAMDCESGWLDEQIKGEIAIALGQIEEVKRGCGKYYTAR